MFTNHTIDLILRSGFLQMEQIKNLDTFPPPEASKSEAEDYSCVSAKLEGSPLSESANPGAEGWGEQPPHDEDQKAIACLLDAPESAPRDTKVFDEPQQVETVKHHHQVILHDKREKSPQPPPPGAELHSLEASGEAVLEVVPNHHQPSPEYNSHHRGVGLKVMPNLLSYEELKYQDDAGNFKIFCFLFIPIKCFLKYIVV